MDAVFGGGLRVPLGRLHAGVAEQVGDQHQVGAAAHQGGGEGVPKDVGGGVVVEPRRLGDAGDDVAGAPDRQPPAAVVEEQRRIGRGPGLVGTLLQPQREVSAELWVDWDLADLAALADQAKLPFAGRQMEVVDVERHGLGDAGAGVERHAGQGPVAGARCASTARSQRRMARLPSARGAVWVGGSARSAVAGPRPRRV